VSFLCGVAVGRERRSGHSIPHSPPNSASDPGHLCQTQPLREKEAIKSVTKSTLNDTPTLGGESWITAVKAGLSQWWALGFIPAGCVSTQMCLSFHMSLYVFQNGHHSKKIGFTHVYFTSNKMCTVWVFTAVCNCVTITTLKMWTKPAQVAQTHNPSYSGGRDQEDHGSKPAWANSLQNPISKNPTHGAGGVA
jgi:hypothetical protein